MAPRIPRTTRQQVFDPTPFLVREFVAAHDSASLPKPKVICEYPSVYPEIPKSGKANVNMT
jgi:hypothetical protein